MKQFQVELYRHFDRPKPEGAGGSLCCYTHTTAAAVSVNRRRPAVLIIPGGGYDHVSAREGEPVALRFFAKGYNAYVLNYSVAPLRFPAPLREAAMAMRYIREAGEETDPSMVAAVGFSAGGHLCGMLGTLFDAPELADIGAPNLLRPDGLGLCYSVAVSWGKTHEGSFRHLCGGDEALRARLSLDALARRDMPPTFLWHTRDDESVPCRNTLILARRLEELGVDMALHLYRHGRHGLSTADEQAYGTDRVPETSSGVAEWLETMMRFFADIGLCVTDGTDAAGFVNLG